MSYLITILSIFKALFASGQGRRSQAYEPIAEYHIVKFAYLEQLLNTERKNTVYLHRLCNTTQSQHKCICSK